MESDESKTRLSRKEAKKKSRTLRRNIAKKKLRSEAKESNGTTSKPKKRTRKSKHTTKSKRLKLEKSDSGCDCEYLSAITCHNCAAIAREINGRYGKRLALSDRELKVKSPAGDPKRDDDQQMLVFSDQACDCPEVNADQCQICAAFTVKMGAFVKIYCDTDGDMMEEDGADSSSADDDQESACKCVYLSNINCDSCRNIINTIEYKYGKKVYRKRPKTTNKICGSPTSNFLNGSSDVVYQQPEPSVPKVKTDTPSATKISGKSIHPKPAMRHINGRVIVAVDCEMVGCIDHKQLNAKGRPKMISALARCSIVDVDCKTVLDIYVKPELKISDYRYRYSGIKPEHMKNAIPAKEARNRIIKTLVGKIVVGHTIESDFSAINYKHPAAQTRDIKTFKRLRDMYLKKTGLSGPGLKCIGLAKLSGVLLNSRIQTGTHCSVEDARHTMMLYLLVQESYEAAMSCDDTATRALELINNDEDDCFNQTTSYLNVAQHLLT